MSTAQMLASPIVGASYHRFTCRGTDLAEATEQGPRCDKFAPGTVQCYIQQSLDKGRNIPQAMARRDHFMSGF